MNAMLTLDEIKMYKEFLYKYTKLLEKAAYQSYVSYQVMKNSIEAAKSDRKTNAAYVVKNLKLFVTPYKYVSSGLLKLHIIKGLDKVEKYHLDQLKQKLQPLDKSDIHYIANKLLYTSKTLDSLYSLGTEVYKMEQHDFDLIEGIYEGHLDAAIREYISKEMFGQFHGPLFHNVLPIRRKSDAWYAYYTYVTDSSVQDGAVKQKEDLRKFFKGNRIIK